MDRRTSRALLPYRDWELRPDPLWRAGWLTGDLIGYWRADRPLWRAGWLTGDLIGYWRADRPPPATDATARPAPGLTN